MGRINNSVLKTVVSELTTYDKEYAAESISRSEKGYVLHIEGKPVSIYGEVTVMSKQPDVAMYVLTETEAREWAQENMTAEEYTTIFGVTNN